MIKINKNIFLFTLGLWGTSSFGAIQSLGFVAPGVDSESAVLNPEQGEIVFTDDSSTTDLKVYTGVSEGWKSLINGSSDVNQSYEVSNLGLAAAPSGSDLVISLKTAAGATPSPSDSVSIGF